MIGGAIAINVEDYIKVNGYSNKYWGWGGEDDDMGIRVMAKDVNIVRPPKV